MPDDPEGMTGTLKKKAGPLPVWAWAVAGTAGIAGYMYYRNKKNAAAAAAQQQDSGDSSNLGNVPISNLSTSAQPMPIQMGDTFVNVPPDEDEPQPPPPKTKPPKRPPPPSGGKPPPPHPSPPPAPVPKPTGTKTVKVCPYPAWCGSLWGIAAHEWGNGNLWPTIYNANKAIIGANPNKIHVGQVLTIPEKPK